MFPGLGADFPGYYLYLIINVLCRPNFPGCKEDLLHFPGQFPLRVLACLDYDGNWEFLAAGIVLFWIKGNTL